MSMCFSLLKVFRQFGGIKKMNWPWILYNGLGLVHCDISPAKLHSSGFLTDWFRPFSLYQLGYPVSICWYLSWSCGRWGRTGSSTTPSCSSWTTACGAQAGQRILYYEGLCGRLVWVSYFVQLVSFGIDNFTYRFFCLSRGGGLQLLLFGFRLPHHKSAQGSRVRWGPHAGKDWSKPLLDSWKMLGNY